MERHPREPRSEPLAQLARKPLFDGLIGQGAEGTEERCSAPSDVAESCKGAERRCWTR
jgi:hypothetical protein